MNSGTRKCSVCEEFVPAERIKFNEECAVPAAEHLLLNNSTGSQCRVVICERCYEQEIGPCADDAEVLFVATLSKHHRAIGVDRR